MLKPSCLRRYLTWLSAGAALCGLLMSGLAQAQTTNVLQEDFTGTAPNLSWSSFGGACLTAGSAINSGPSANGIPACLGDSYYSNGDLSYNNPENPPVPQVQTGLTNNQDKPGKGALRLTNGCAVQNGQKVCYYSQAGAIILNSTYPSNQGINVTFTTYTYGGDNNGGHGADGIGFYILNGSFPPNIGAWGGSLGYSCSNSNSPYNGMAGAYLGLGMDEYGNFLNGSVSQNNKLVCNGDNTRSGLGKCQTSPGEIGIRGYGNINLAALRAINPNATTADVRNACINGSYSYNGTTYSLPDYPMVPPPSGGYPTGLQIANESATTRSQATPITYTLKITPDAKLSLWYKYNATNTVGGLGTSVLSNVSIANTAVYGPMPSTFRFGFGASTGGSNNVHEITCFQVVPATQAVTSPVAPVSISGGSYIYSLSSDPDPIAGHVQAFQTVAAPTSSASAPLGTATGNAIWDAGDSTHMSATMRTASLYSTSATSIGGAVGSGTAPLLTSLDSAAFGTWTTSSCLPSGSTGIGIIEQYTIDPNYTNGTCTYLAGRKPGWMLGGMSSNDSAGFLAPPGNANLLSLPGYVAFAQANKSREKAVLFTSNDGFLYASDAISGNLIWGWMPRPFVSYLGNAPGLVGATCGNPVTNGACFDGQFTTIDAVNTTTANATASNWATYIVGTAAGGSYHYALQLTTNTSGAPMPTNQTWGVSVAGGSSPQEQAPVIATINGQQYALFTVNTTTNGTTTSKFYEVNVATGAGASTSATLPFVAYSSMTYVPATGTLWMGDAKGGVWSMNVSGSASADASAALQVATMSPAGAVLFVGYTEIGGLPYIWAASANEIEAFSLSGANSLPLWASTGGNSPTGYLGNGSGSLSTSTAVMALQTGGQISAAPALINGVLVVPVYVPPTSSCAITGTGYYDLFDLVSGGLPKISITYKNNVITNGIISLGLGIPYTPTYTVTASGTLVYPGNSQPVTPTTGISPIQFGGNVMNKPISWRQY